MRRGENEKASLSNTNTSATWIFHIFPLSADVRKKSNFETAKHDVRFVFLFYRLKKLISHSQNSSPEKASRTRTTTELHFDCRRPRHNKKLKSSPKDSPLCRVADDGSAHDEWGDVNALGKSA